MHYVMRLALALAILNFLPLRAAPEMQTEYKQADSSYYLRSDLFAADPAAMIAPSDAVTKMGGTYLIETKGKAPGFVYLQESQDWIEPITPPSEPANLNISSAAMEVREPQGNVQVALPSAPSDFKNVERGQVLPNGAVLRTGDNGSVAVLFGGVDSVRLAPNSQAAVQMNVEKGTRDVEIDIRSGMAFSKVGSRVGEKQAYKVHTPFGDAMAHGTDYVTVVYPGRVDVWVAQGTVELAEPGGSKLVTSSNGHEPLKVMRNPAAKDAATALAQSAESLTALLNFIPMANQKMKALAERTQSGAHLTATEKDYVGRIRKVVSLIRLGNLSAPAEIAAPTPPPAPKTVSTTPPVAKPEPRALPVEPQRTVSTAKKAPLRALPVESKPVTAAAPASKAPLRALPVEPQPASVFKPAAFKTKPVVIVLPPAHFPKVPAGEDTTATKLEKMAAKKPATATENSKTKTAAAGEKISGKPGKHYLRAKPVDAAELAQDLAARKASPAPAAASHAEVDPNSLGSPLSGMMPMHPVLAPRPPEPEVSVPTATKPAAGYAVP